MRVRAFDFFRGVAIIGVMFHHYVAGPLSNLVALNYPDNSFFINSLINSGWLGVTVFFVLSGAVLYNVNISNSISNISGYYRHRFFRLIPLYFILIIASFIIDHRGMGALPRESFWLLTGLHNVRPSLWMPDLLWVCWSLGLEILFSVAVPFIILMMKKFKLMHTVIVCASVCWIYRIFADHAWFVMNPDYKNHLINPFMDNIFGRIDDFIIGMAAGSMIRNRKNVNYYYVIAAAAILIASLYGWGVVIEEKRTFILSVMASTLHLSVSGSVAILLIAAARSSVFNRQFASPIVFMGTICYSVYFMHAFLMRHFQMFSTEYYWNSHKSIGGVVLISAYALAVTLALSTITFVYIEAAGIKHVPVWATALRRRIGQTVQAALSWRPPRNWRAKLD